MNKKGFTLAEVMVVIAVVALMGIILTEIFFRTFRAGNKAQVLATIKKNGQSILETMDKSIRNAKEVVIICDGDPSSPDGIDDTIIIKNQQGQYLRYRFTKEVLGTTNGKLQSDTPDMSNVVTSTDLLAKCIDSLDSPINLSDDSTQNGVSVVPTVTSFISKPADKNEVTIEFGVKPPVGAPNFGGQIDPVIFKTTVSLR